MSSITRFQFEQMQARLNRPGAPASSTASPPLEKELHRQIMDHCDKQWPRWKHIRSRMDKPTHNALGVPDFIIFMPCAKVLVVECKRPGQKLSLAQQAWQHEMAMLGHIVHVIHDLPEFLSAVAPVGQPLSNPSPTTQ